MNQEDFLKCHGTAKSLLFILTATFNISDQALRFAVINLFLSMARVEVGRRLLFQHVDADRYALFVFCFCGPPESCQNVIIDTRPKFNLKIIVTVLFTCVMAL